LRAAGISWQVYQDLADNYTDNPLAGFKTFRDAVDGLPGSDPSLRERGMSTRSLDQLRADVLAGTLPQVSFIVATAEGSEQPTPSSPAQGAHYTAAVLQALTASDQVWRQTVFFLMFDENDGWFDHVPPPAVPSYRVWHADPAQAELAGASTVSTAGEYHEFSSGEATESPALMHRPYGLGPRVPLTVISPWSRGGWVNSQVFDHTSVIRFIERRFGVVEPNISAWRRAVCGDLASAFDFARPDDSPFMASLPPTDALAARARLLELSVPAPPPVPTLPLQARGTRPSRALPYALHVHERLHAHGIELTFVNIGSAGAVFHVYDKCHLAQGPRRYTVEAGKALSGLWTGRADEAYDLWVLGPNGFHRHFRGRFHAKAPTLRLAYGGGSISIALANPGATALCWSVDAPSYPGTDSWRVTVAPGETATRVFLLGASANWYDFIAQVDALPGYGRRVAGRAETGAHGVSDPAMGCGQGASRSAP
jgi:phospholipase C